MITATIIEDEENLRMGLKALLKTYCPDVNVIAEADSVKSALESLKQQTPQIVFLDIQLSDGTGFDVLEKIAIANDGKINMHIIFITAHDQYAVKAFKFSALDYLLKPVDPGELQVAVNKVKDKIPQNNLSDHLELLIENIRAKTVSPKRLALHTTEGIHVFNISDIIRCESQDNYTRFFISNHKPILVSKTLKEYESLLSGHGFERIHQSHLINLAHLKSYIKTEAGYVVMNDAAEIPVSQRKRERMMQLLKSL